MEATMPSADSTDSTFGNDWRFGGYYLSANPCCVCGSLHKIGTEPRFGYPVCEEHSKLAPVQISE
jgi:hypothetical protein